MSNDWIDAEGFRANVGIILVNNEGKLLLCGRKGSKGWQFPQGGVLVGEDPVEAMFRELREEIGLARDDVALLGATEDWLRYTLPRKFVRWGSQPLCVGQKQLWFMLQLVAADGNLRFDLGDEPEFDRVRWVDYWRPVNEVIYFKRRVYARALLELGSTAYPLSLPPRPGWWPQRWRSAFDKDIAALQRETEQDDP